MKTKTRILGLAVVLTLWLQTARAGIVFTDDFSDRHLYNNSSLSGTGSNVGATSEPGEPKHVGKLGGASVWYSWHATLNGVLTISTAGSGFDTLLAVYTGDNLSNLVAVAADDDGGGNLTSQVKFAVQGGKTYQIAIDGYNGATGDIVLNWSFQIALGLPPLIPSLAQTLTVGLGEKVSLGVGLTINDPLISLQWYLDGKRVSNGQQSLLGIDSVALTNVGFYTLQLTLLGLIPITLPVETINLQINSTDGSVDRDAMAQDKFGDVLGQGPSLLSLHARPGRLDNGPVGGYSGTQMFSTYGATMEPGEPYNCNLKGGASAWYSFTAPTNGTLYINTDGSSFDTTLGVYTMPPKGSSYSDLQSVACDNNSGTNGRTSAVRFQATAGTTYYVSVDGINGATGQVVLTYNLGDPLVIVAPPQPKLANAGENTSLSVGTWGTQPVAFQWAKDGVAVSGATASSLAINNAQQKQAGRYSVTASNLVSIVSTWTTFALYSKTLTLTGPQNKTVTQGVEASLAVTANGTAPLIYQWFYQGQPLAGATNASLALPAIQPAAAGSYFVQVWDANGSQISASAALTVSPVPAVTQQPQSQSAAIGATVTFTVAAAGAPKLAYQWRLANSLVPNATNSTLAIAKVQAANAGDYTVVVSNGSGAVTSQVATLTVLQAPVITQQPQSQVSTTSASFSVAATGAGPLTYQWRFNGTAIKAATASKYVISSIQMSDYGNYTVVVTNGVGSVTSSTAVLSSGNQSTAAATIARLVPGLDFSFDKSSGSFQFTLPSMPNGPYQIQCSENLRDWRDLGSIIATNGLVQFQDTTAGAQSARFYRAVPGEAN